MLKLCIGLLAGTVFSAPVLGQGTMYLLDSNRTLYTVDIATGVRTQVAVIPNDGLDTVGGLAYDCLSQTMYLSSTTNDTLHRLDLTTFTATLLGPYSADVVMHGIEWDRSSGTLFGASGGNLYTIDTSSGQATVVGNAGFTSFLNLGFHDQRDVLYGAANTTPEALYAIDRATGAGTFIGLMNGPTNPHGMAYVPHNNTLYLVDSTTDTLYTLDVDTGATTVVGALGTGNYLGLAWVPETCPVANVDGRLTLVGPANCLIGTGEQATWVATAHNSGQTPITNATVTFTMPAGSTFVSSVPAATPSGNTVTVNLGTLAPAASATFSVSVTVPTVGPATAQGSLTITQADDLPLNNNKTATSVIAAATPATAAARAVLSNIPGQANSEVPGFPDQHFSTTGFDRPFRSPNGNFFVLTADTDVASTTGDQVMLVGNASDVVEVGAREGQTGPDGANWGTFDTVQGINDSGHFVFSNNTTFTTLDEVIVKWNGTEFVNVIVEGNQVPNTSFVLGSTSGSATIQNDGSVSFQGNFTGATATTDTGIFRNNAEDFVAQEGTTVPTGQIIDGLTVKTFDTGTTDGQGFFLSADGAHYLWSGTVNDVIAQDRVVVVDNAVVIQEGAVIPGSTFGSTVSAVNFSHMESNGDWLAYGSNLDTADWAVRNGTVVAQTGMPITPGAMESWSDAISAQCFLFTAGNPAGNYVVGGMTDADALSNTVLVLNGDTVLARENDPIDLDNDGAFDDNVYIRDFLDDFGFLTDTHLYIVVDVRDGASARGCSTADEDLGQALVKIALPSTGPLCGTSDFNGDGAPGLDDDIEAFFLCLGGDCCAECWVNGSDFNGDGAPGLDDDIESFFLVLGGGTCV